MVAGHGLAVAAQAGAGRVGADEWALRIGGREILEAPAGRGGIAPGILDHHAEHLALTFGDRMIVQYTAAALVNDLATRAHPASVYSVPTSANAEDHVSMGANEARHVLEMTEDLGHVLALELYTAAQALDYRQDMLNAARRLAQRGDWRALAAKIANAPDTTHPARTQFEAEVQALAKSLGEAADFRAGATVRDAHAKLRERIAFMARDRAMDGDIRAVCELVAARSLDLP